MGLLLICCFRVIMGGDLSIVRFFLSFTIFLVGEGSLTGDISGTYGTACKDGSESDDYTVIVILTPLLRVIRIC